MRLILGMLGLTDFLTLKFDIIFFLKLFFLESQIYEFSYFTALCKTSSSLIYTLKIFKYTCIAWHITLIVNSAVLNLIFSEFLFIFH